MQPNAPVRYEDYADVIEVLLLKSKAKWSLTVDGAWSYDDVCQTIRAHIDKKLKEGLYDPSRKFEPWCYCLISHQISNLLKSKYYNHRVPCVAMKCLAFSSADSSCAIYGDEENCMACPLMKNWAQTKKFSQQIREPLTLENHQQEVYDMPNTHLDLIKGLADLSHLLEKELSRQDFYIYKAIYIDGLEEEKAIQAIGYKSLEANRSAGQFSLIEIKKRIIAAAKIIVYEELDLS